MNRIKYALALASSLLISWSGLSAELDNSISTDPVGVITYTANAQSDSRIGSSMLRATSAAGVISSVSGANVTVSFDLPDVTTEAHFIWINSGALEGEWYGITSSTTSTLTVAEDLQAEGLQTGDSFSILPFWTLGTLFPNGGGVPPSTDIFNPSARIFLYDPNEAGTNLSPNESHFYHDGSSGFLPAGWYNTNSFESSDNVVVNPETYMTLRNSTGNAAELKFFGSVPVKIFANTILSSSAETQDNLVNNPYPADMTFANSDLVSSGAVEPSTDLFNPTDRVFLFDSNSTSFNSNPRQ